MPCVRPDTTLFCDSRNAFKAMKIQKVIRTMGVTPVRARRLFSVHCFVCIAAAVYFYASLCMQCARGLYSGAKNEAMDAIREGGIDENGASQLAKVHNVGIDTPIRGEELQHAAPGNAL
jgi:hypothetical protein